MVILVNCMCNPNPTANNIIQPIFYFLWFSSTSLSSTDCHCLERPSGPICLDPGTYLSLKSKRRMAAIHRFMEALGWISGLLIIPLMYLASTSIVKFWTPIIQTFIALRAWKRPHNSILACEYLDSQIIQVIDPKREGRWRPLLSSWNRIHLQAVNGQYDFVLQKVIDGSYGWWCNNSFFKSIHS